MRVPFRLPLYVVVAALVALIAVLATLQYRWLGRISDAERERMKTTLNTRASAFAQDLDRELTRAYVTFQFDPMQAQEGAAARTSARYDRWQATAKYPRLIKDVYLVTADDQPNLQRFNPATKVVESAEWPAILESIRATLARVQPPPPDGPPAILKALPPPAIEEIPAIVIPTPILFLNNAGRNATFTSQLSCTVVLLDRQYIEHELLPMLAQQHFRGTSDGVDYQLAVIRPEANGVLYHSTPEFSPAADARVDASVDLFQVKVQEFNELVSEVRRFSAFVSNLPHAADARGSARFDSRRAIVRETFTMPVPSAALKLQQGPPLSVVVEQTGAVTPDKLAAVGTAATRIARPPAPHWRLMVKHPAGSLENAVDSARRRNLLVSSSILAVLGVSFAFLIMSTKRAQALARRQVEFVATVSHELRTPLAVIRSAADNLADGVVTDENHVRRYGVLVRDEGRRLSELVEQVLEYAGLQSGERMTPPQPVPLDALLRDVVSSPETLGDTASVAIEMSIPDSLPPVAGDEAALRRVFQNLFGNALKYGGERRWVGIQARAVDHAVEVSVADRGMGISAADQARIFDPFYRAPDVVAAQIQGAGLGLSLVKRIVDAHGGRILVKSAPGAGSTFVVSLPIAAGAPAGAPRGAGAAAAQQS